MNSPQEDVFTNEKYLLYSPAVKLTLQERNPLLWFNLISFNGECWQTYGFIAAYNSFTTDDIFFYATEVNHKINNEQDMPELIPRLQGKSLKRW